MASSQDKHNLHNLLLGKRWVEATSRTKIETGREELRRRDKHGRLPLHVACDYGAPWELVEAMLDGYPVSARRTDRRSQLPLHYACEPRYGVEISPPVVRLLLDAYPEGAKATGLNGYLPLHGAADEKAPSEVLAMLIEAHPDGVTTSYTCGRVDTSYRCGRLPLHFLVENKIVSPSDKEDVQRIELLLRPLLDDEDACLSKGFSTGETPLGIGAKFDMLTLQACLRISRCPAEIVVTVANRHPGQLREKDDNGSLPLHMAAANPNLNGAEDDGEDLISKWIRLYPDAAATSNVEGRCPLNLAIESGKSWKQGVEAIADAAKGVRTIRDVGTNLFPFMLAASRADPCITTVYELLRCCPDICKKP